MKKKINVQYKIFKSIVHTLLFFRIYFFLSLLLTFKLIVANFTFLML